MKIKKFFLKILREIMRLFGVPWNIRTYILSFFDKDVRWEYEIRTKKFTLEEIDNLMEIQALFPKNILDYEKTLDEIILNKKSVSRLGDGEEFTENILNEKPLFPLLKQRLTEILEHGSDENVLVCTNNFNVFDKNVPMFFRNHFGRFWQSIGIEKFKKVFHFNSKTFYGDAYAFLFYFNENDDGSLKRKKLEKIKSIWQNKKILFVISKNSNILKDEKFFLNAQKTEYVYAPSQWAFTEYDRILNQITQNYDKDWLIYLELGSCATVLSYDLAKMGYQALDMGDFYSRIIMNRRYRDFV